MDRIRIESRQDFIREATRRIRKYGGRLESAAPEEREAIIVNIKRTMAHRAKMLAKCVTERFRG